MLIRQETAADHDRVDAVHRGAFGDPAVPTDPAEVRLVRELREDAGYIPSLSLVAEDTNGSVVGHVICTRGHLDAGRAVGLGPLGVARDLQAHGVGSALMHAVLAAADALEFDVVLLLGHLEYYPRFGFVPAGSIGIIAPDAAWGDHFQARRLSSWTPAVGGRFRYAAPFERL